MKDLFNGSGGWNYQDLINFIFLLDDVINIILEITLRNDLIGDVPIWHFSKFGNHIQGWRFLEHD